jgi:hypothetical protein
MDGKFHLFDAIVKAISSVYELPHKTQGVEAFPHPNPLPQAGEGTVRSGLIGLTGLVQCLTSCLNGSLTLTLSRRRERGQSGAV